MTTIHKSTIWVKSDSSNRIRYKSEARDHLEYIDESSDTRRRIQSLARGVYADWQNWREPLARNWMSLDWSEPYRLAERLDADPPDVGVYRIWYEGQDSTLAYIGESSNISSRLYNHEQTFGEDALFSYAKRSDLDASHKRAEIETDLIGAYYLAVGEAPLAQFGHTENVHP